MGGGPKTPEGGAPVLRFADTARRLGAAARAAGLTVPAFRCPPRVPGACRTVRRFPGGSVISVVLGGRTSGKRYQAANALLATAYRGVASPPPAVASRRKATT